MNFIKFKKNNLCVENLSGSYLAKRYRTPFYCYSLRQLKNNFNLFRNAFKENKPLICFSLKSNSNINLLKELRKMGSGADVVSVGELRRALKAGIKAKKIVFSGVGKKFSEIKFAIEKNILQINIESIEELELITKIAKNLRKKVQIGIRINPNIDAKTHTKISTGREEDKFGLNIETAEKIFLNYRSNPNLDIVGLSVHIGSQIMSLSPFKKAFLKIKNFIKKINKNEKIIKFLDLGGGIGINYKDEKIINFNSYAKIISDISNDLGCKLILEPGRILVAESGILVTRVLFIKKNKKKTFAIIDTGMNDLLRPALYDAYHDIQSIKKGIGRKSLYTIVGPICETADTFAKNKLLNRLNTGEILFFKNVGAYGASMSSSYNSRPIIMELIIHKKNFSIIRTEDTVLNQISREKIPSWVSKIK